MCMTHKQRIENAISFQETDRIPYSMWMHFPNRDRHPRRLAELSLMLQRKYDLDFIKFMPFGLYSAIDYGLDLDVFPGFSDAPVANRPLVEDVKDWDKIRFVPGTGGEYAVVLEAQRILFEMMDDRVPFLQTVFSPMTTAAKMSSPALLVKHIAEDGARVRRALEKITAATVQFVKASAALGADGFFFASQMSTEKAMDREVYEGYVKKYDFEVLDTVKGNTWFNVLHLHGAGARMHEAQEYPVQVLSWHDRDDGPSMEEVRGYSRKAFLGGLSWGSKWMKKMDEDVLAEVREVGARDRRKGIILGPGCVMEPSTPAERLELVHRAVLATAEI